jgi:hypothetical protein
VDAGRKLNTNQTSITLTLSGGGGTAGVQVVPVRVQDDPDATDPDVNISGTDPWTATLNFLLQYGTAPYTVQLDADYGTSWNDGTPGRVYSISGSPFAAPGLLSGTANINNQSPGTYAFALRVTDANAATYTYVWPTPVALNAQGWTNSQPNAATAGNVGQYNSMAIVNGFPAMTFWNFLDEDLYYVRATDANGANWGTPLKLDGTGTDRGWNTSLAVINGNPAVAYTGSGGIGATGLYYVRANDANGSAWGSVVTLFGGGWSGTSLQTVNGNPAIACAYEGDGNIYYIRATDANGGGWGGFVGLSGGDWPSMQIVSGNPAVAFYRNGDACYIRATDADGSGWGSRKTADNANGTGDVGWYPSLAVVNGRPAIAHYDSTNGDLRYVRAQDATGATWGPSTDPIILDNGGGLPPAGGDTGAFPSLAVIGGNPAVSYFDISGGRLRYITASDASGSSWNAALTLDANNAGDFSCLRDVNGQPGISYYEGTNGDLKFIRYYP